MDEHRDANNRLTYDFSKIEGSSYRKITDAIAKKFDLSVASGEVAGLDEVFQDFKQGSLVVGLEWNIWSGYSVVAKRAIAEPLAQEIASYISAEFNS